MSEYSNGNTAKVALPESWENIPMADLKRIETKVNNLQSNVDGFKDGSTKVGKAEDVEDGATMQPSGKVLATTDQLGDGSVNKVADVTTTPNGSTLVTDRNTMGQFGTSIQGDGKNMSILDLWKMVYSLGGRAGVYACNYYVSWVNIVFFTNTSGTPIVQFPGSTIIVDTCGSPYGIWRRFSGRIIDVNGNIAPFSLGRGATVDGLIHNTFYVCERHPVAASTMSAYSAGIQE